MFLRRLITMPRCRHDRAIWLAASLVAMCLSGCAQQSPLAAESLADAPSPKFFQITPRRPVADLLREAEVASPPLETGDFLESDLVELTKLEPGIRLDIRYAGANNFLSTPIYRQARAFLQRPAAEALVRVHRALAQQGYGLLVHDAYRPWYVTKVFWEATREADHAFVADPAQGSRHNRGCAVDLTLYVLATGAVVEMPGLYDEMSERSAPDYPGGTASQRALRDRLRRAMEAERFSVEPTEWWHYDFHDWARYRIGNQRFEALDAH